MAPNVFISYSTKDKSIADAVCAALEAKKIRCWIASRDIRAGQDWNTAIIDAISASRIMVLIWSSQSNTSPDVALEVRHAFRRGITVIPFRLDNTHPTKALEYYLTFVHYLDAQTPPLGKHLEQLVEYIEASLLQQNQAPNGTEETPPDENDNEATRGHSTLSKLVANVGERVSSASKRMSWYWLLLIAVILVFSGISILALLVWPQSQREGYVNAVLQKTLEGHSRNDVDMLSFSPDSKTLATGTNSEVRLWDSRTGEFKQDFHGGNKGLFSISFSPDGKTLAIGSVGQVDLWDTQTATLRRTFRRDDDKDYTYALGQLAFSHDGKLLAASGRMISIWDIETGQLKQTLADNIPRDLLFTFFPNDNILTIGGNNESGHFTLTVCDVTTGETKQTSEVKQYYSAISSDGRTGADFNNSDATLRLWYARTGNLLSTFRSEKQRIRALVFSPDGFFVISGSDDGIVQIWDTNGGDGSPRLKLAGSYGHGIAVSISPDRKTIASGGWNGKVELWSISNL
jgi:WD40 repeat protein